jgi:hypothetical protein
MMIDCVFKRNIAHLCQIGNIFEKIFLCRVGVCHNYIAAQMMIDLLDVEKSESA